MTLDPSALPLLTGDVRAVLSAFLILLNRDVQQKGVPAQSVEVRGTADPEDGTTQVLVRLWVGGWAEREMRHYYQEFGRVVDEWMRTLSGDQRETFVTRVSFQARRAPYA